jgi:DNA-binding NarL/FixJ family response regulator
MVDDHPLILSGLRDLLSSNPEFDVRATCGTAEEGWSAIVEHRPDIVILDLKLPGTDGLAVLRRLDPTQPPAVVLLTAAQEEDLLLDAVRLGARGIVRKATAPRVLEDCLRTVHAGGTALELDGIDMAARVAQRQAVERELEDTLTSRELEIVGLVAQNLDNAGISRRLSISPGTVKIHLHHVYDKLQLRGREDLQTLLRDRGY